MAYVNKKNCEELREEVKDDVKREVFDIIKQRMWDSFVWILAIVFVVFCIWRIIWFNIHPKIAELTNIEIISLEEAALPLHIGLISMCAAVGVFVLAGLFLYWYYEVWR